jgi:hypothetical protein
MSRSLRRAYSSDCLLATSGAVAGPPRGLQRMMVLSSYRNRRVVVSGGSRKLSLHKGMHDSADGNMLAELDAPLKATRYPEDQHADQQHDQCSPRSTSSSSTSVTSCVPIPRRAGRAGRARGRWACCRPTTFAPRKTGRPRTIRAPTRSRRPTPARRRRPSKSRHRRLHHHRHTRTANSMATLTPEAQHGAVAAFGPTPSRCAWRWRMPSSCTSMTCGLPAAPRLARIDHSQR